MPPAHKSYSGFFLTLEGGEGAGKSTLAEHLSRELEERAIAVVRTREPGGTLFSEQIRALLLDPKRSYPVGQKAELLMFLAARAQHIEEKIAPALHQGKYVICERFHDSTIAYQGCARHLGMQAVEQLIEHTFDKDWIPDRTLFLDIAPEVAFRRIEAHRLTSLDRMEQEKLQFHREVRQGFLHLADKYPERITVLDATLPIDVLVGLALKRIF